MVNEAKLYVYGSRLFVRVVSERHPRRKQRNGFELRLVGSFLGNRLWWSMWIFLIRQMKRL